MDMPEWLAGRKVRAVYARDPHGFVFIRPHVDRVYVGRLHPVEDYWDAWDAHEQTLIIQLSLLTGPEVVFMGRDGEFYREPDGNLRAPHPKRNLKKLEVSHAHND